MTLTRESRRIAGLLLLSIVAIESGGYYLTRIVGGAVDVTDFQLGFSRAGHAHAGVLVTLSLIAIVLADAADTALATGRTGTTGEDASTDPVGAGAIGTTATALPAATSRTAGVAGPTGTPGAAGADATAAPVGPAGIAGGGARRPAHSAGRMGLAGWVARLGIPTAAILMPAGFFFSSMGAGRTEPNGFIVLLWLGAVSLAAGALTLGVRLLRSTRTTENAPARAIQR
jgi:hypothetical protein